MKGKKQLINKTHNIWYIDILSDLSARVKRKGVGREGFRMGEQRRLCKWISVPLLHDLFSGFADILIYCMVSVVVKVSVFGLIRNFGLT